MRKLLLLILGSVFFLNAETAIGQNPTDEQSPAGIQSCEKSPGATADEQISAAIATLPPQGGIVDCRGLSGTVNIAATITLGSAEKLVTFLADRGHTQFNCTITNGTPCWKIYPGSAMVFAGPGICVGNSCGLSVSDSAKVSNVILAVTSGTNRPLLDNVYIRGNGSAVITDAVVDLGNILDGATINNLGIGGYANTYLLKITNERGSTGPANINNADLDCQGIKGCRVVLIDALVNRGVIGTLNFNGGSFTHPGPGGLAIITVQDSGGNGQNAMINFNGPQIESINSGDIGIWCNGCRGLTVDSLLATAHVASGADVIRISGSGGFVNLRNIFNFNLWTNTLNNQANGTLITSARNSFLSNYTMSRYTSRMNNAWEDAAGNIVTIDTNQGLSTRALRASGAPARLSGTGACANITAQTGGAWSGTFKCSGRTGASTVTIAPGTTAPNGWNCSASDETAGTPMPQSAHSATTCTIKGQVAKDDFVTFTSTSY